VASERELDALRRMFEGRNLSDVAQVAQEGWHPDIVYREDPKFPGAGVFRGRDAVVARFAEYREAIDVVHASVVQLTDASDGILAVVRTRGSGSASGVPIDHDWAYLIRLDDGLVRELNAYFDPDQARAVAGVRS
jgi:ketosteroid isomerase-like protein